MKKKHQALNYKILSSLILPMIVALLAMASVCWLGSTYFSNKWFVLPTVAFASITYFFILQKMCVEEASTLVAQFSKKIKRVFS